MGGEGTVVYSLIGTAASLHDKRLKYKLLPGVVHIKISTIIQEVRLEFQHEGRTGSAAECTLKDADHATIMTHNFATYT